MAYTPNSHTEKSSGVSLETQNLKQTGQRNNQHLHVAGNEFTCSYCPRNFSTRAPLSRHIRSQHDPNYRFVLKCVVCGHICRDNADLERHMRKHTSEKPYSCSICKRSFALFHNLKSHLKTHYQLRKKPYSCVMCERIFSTRFILQSHIHNIHTREKPYSCSVCRKAFPTKCAVKNHAVVHSDYKPFSCDECLLKCRTKSQLTFHIRAVHRQDLRFSCEIRGRRFSSHHLLRKKHHVDSKDIIKQCLFCGQYLRSLIALEHHTAGHTGEKWYFCATCPDTFAYHDTLRRHELSAHGISKQKKTVTVKRFECFVCQKKLASRRNLNAHILKHTGETPLKCESCGQSFSNKLALERHMMGHKNRQQFVCSQCDSCFLSNIKLSRHLQSVHGVGEKESTKIECVVCGKILSSSFKLNLHMRTHTGEKPFFCTECGRRFSDKSKLVLHLRTHLEIKPFPCAICGKSFATQSVLMNHCRSHVNERPYPCPECPFVFSDSNSLKRHIVTVHRKEKRFSCNICKKSFATSSTRNYHIKTHLMELPYGCSICRLRYRSKLGLKRHLKDHKTTV